jgi:hypothetical protein
MSALMNARIPMAATALRSSFLVAERGWAGENAEGIAVIVD